MIRKIGQIKESCPALLKQKSVSFNSILGNDLFLKLSQKFKSVHCCALRCNNCNK